MMFVPVKSMEQQGILALHSARSLLVKQQTMLANGGSGANLMGPSAMLAPGTREVGDGQAGVPWKNCSRADTSTGKSSYCACAGIFGSSSACGTWWR